MTVRRQATRSAPGKGRDHVGSGTLVPRLGRCLPARHRAPCPALPLRRRTRDHAATGRGNGDGGDGAQHARAAAVAGPGQWRPVRSKGAYGPPAAPPAARNRPLRTPPDRRSRWKSEFGLHHPVRAADRAASWVGPGWTRPTGTGSGTASEPRPADVGPRLPPRSARRASGRWPPAAPPLLRPPRTRGAADAPVESSVSRRTGRMVLPGWARAAGACGGDDERAGR